MNIDKIDLKLLKRLFEIGKDEKTSTTELANEILQPTCRNDTIKFNSLISSKLKKLVNYGMVTFESTSTPVKFFVDKDDVICPEMTATFYNNGHKKEVASENTAVFSKDGGIYVMMFIEEKECISV